MPIKFNCFKNSNQMKYTMIVTNEIIQFITLSKVSSDYDLVTFENTNNVTKFIKQDGHFYHKIIAFGFKYACILIRSMLVLILQDLFDNYLIGIFFLTLHDIEGYFVPDWFATDESNIYCNKSDDSS